MTKIILSLLLGLSINATAFEVPKDAIIKVYDASGKHIGNMTRAQYKVVKIEENAAALPVLAAAPASCSISKGSGATNNTKTESHALMLQAGEGPDGSLGVSNDGSRFSVRQDRGPVVGASYLYSKGEYKLQFTGLTNKTFLIGFGKEIK